MISLFATQKQENDWAITPNQGALRCVPPAPPYRASPGVLLLCSGSRLALHRVRANTARLHAPAAAVGHNGRLEFDSSNVEVLHAFSRPPLARRAFGVFDLHAHRLCISHAACAASSFLHRASRWIAPAQRSAPLPPPWQLQAGSGGRRNWRGAMGVVR
jgi:hypothetical protein